MPAIARCVDNQLLLLDARRRFLINIVFFEMGVAARYQEVDTIFDKPPPWYPYAKSEQRECGPEFTTVQKEFDVYMRK